MPDEIVIGNGCDDILNLCVRAFCGECEKLAYFWPSYSLYPVLANIQGATQVELPLDENFQIKAHPPLLAKLAGVKLVFITQPNAPSGVWLQRVELQRVIEETEGVVVIDEAYVDFAAENCLDFAREYDNVIVARTFSKAFSFAGMRVGWAAGSRELIARAEQGERQLQREPSQPTRRGSDVGRVGLFPGEREEDLRHAGTDRLGTRQAGLLCLSFANEFRVRASARRR